MATTRPAAEYEKGSCLLARRLSLGLIAAALLVPVDQAGRPRQSASAEHGARTDGLRALRQAFDPSGLRLRYRLSEPRRPVGEFGQSHAFDVGPDGSVFVADWIEERLYRLDPAGGYLEAWGKPGMRDGQLSGIDGLIALSSELLVFMPMNQGAFVRQSSSVQRLGLDGRFIDSWNLDWGRSYRAYLDRRPGAVGPDGSIYLIHDKRIERYDSQRRFLSAWGSEGTGEGEFEGWLSIDVGPDGRVYVADLELARIQVFETDGRFVKAWGRHGTADGELHKPMDIAVGPDGSVYVNEAVDSQMAGEVHRFDAEGRFIERFSGLGEAWLPITTWIDTGPDGSLYVLDQLGGMRRFDASGAERLPWAGWRRLEDSDRDAFHSTRLSVAPDGVAHFVEFHLDALDDPLIQRVSPRGNRLSPIPIAALLETSGDEWESFLALDIAANGNLVFLSDNAIVQATAGGDPISRWGLQGVDPERVWSLHAGRDGRVFLQDMGRDQIHVFDASGNRQASWNVPGGDPTGRFDGRSSLLAMDVGPDGQIYALGEQCLPVGENGEDCEQAWTTLELRILSGEGEVTEHWTLAESLPESLRHPNRPFWPTLQENGPPLLTVTSDGSAIIAGDDGWLAFTASGTFLFASEDGVETGYGATLAVDGLDRLWMADSGVSPGRRSLFRVYASGAGPRWVLRYYDDPHATGMPNSSKEHDDIDIDWADAAPAPGMPDDDWSLELSQPKPLRRGWYDLAIEADGGLRLWLGERMLIEAWHDESTSDQLRVIADGHSDLYAEFIDRGGAARLKIDVAPTVFAQRLFLPTLGPTR